MSKDSILRQAVKDVMCDMAVNDKFPLDITCLDIDEVFKKAELKIKDSEAYILLLRIERAGEYLSTSDVEASEQLELIEAQALVDDSEIIDYIDGVQVIEDYEFELTVKEFLKRIK
jgi:hypothetical protein